MGKVEERRGGGERRGAGGRESCWFAARCATARHGTARHGTAPQNETTVHKLSTE